MAESSRLIGRVTGSERIQRGPHREIRLDQSTHSIQTVDYAHHEIHSGSLYVVRDFVELALNNVVDLRITTPDTTKWAHLLWGFETTGQLEWYLYEDAVISTVGTAITPVNHNRNSSKTSGLAFDIITNTSLANADADTDVTGATELIAGSVGAGKQAGGGSRNNQEFILKQNTIYCFRGIAVAATIVSFDLDWYEHTDRT